MNSIVSRKSPSLFYQIREWDFTCKRFRWSALEGALSCGLRDFQDCAARHLSVKAQDNFLRFFKTLSNEQFFRMNDIYIETLHLWQFSEGIRIVLSSSGTVANYSQNSLLCNIRQSSQTLLLLSLAPFRFFAHLVEVERFPKSLKLTFDCLFSNEECLNAKSRGLKLPRNATL